MVNPLIKALQEECLHTPENVLFLLGMKYKHLHPDLEEHLVNVGDSEILARKFLEYNEESGWELKIDVVQDTNKVFSSFIKALNDEHVGTNGHLNNPLKYSIGRGSLETKNAFFNLNELIPNLDHQVLAQIISEYYAHSKYPTKLSRYLREEAYYAYQEELG